MNELPLHVDPPGVDAYLDGLVRCFGAWGDDAQWRWTFERDAGFGTATRLVVTDEDGSWIAGSGISWRGTTAGGPLGIMTGSWTLPAARRRGCFRRFIRTSAQQTHARGGVALLSFMAADRPSVGPLRASGATLLPTAYLLADPDPHAHAPRWSVRPASPDDARLLRPDDARADDEPHRLTYPSDAHFAGQMIERPLPVSRVDDADRGWTLLVEHAADTDRVLWVAGADDPRAQLELWRDAAAWSSHRGRKLFAFASLSRHRAAAQAAGLRILEGLTAWNAPAPTDDADPGPVAPTLRDAWDIQGGDRM